MLSEIKAALIEHPEYIRSLLEQFGFAHVHVRPSEIRCARQEGGNPSAISIRLVDNDALYCMDYVNAESKDIFHFISDLRSVPYGDVVKAAKAYTGDVETKQHVATKREVRKSEVLSLDVLDKYPKIFSKLFLDDYISLTAQQYFDIRYDEESDRILFPVHNANGELISLKGRVNHAVLSSEPKYLYLYPCVPSETLYNLLSVKQTLCIQSISVGESEKMAMQAFSYGYRNVVGIGGNRLSEQQVAILASLAPKRVNLMLDEGLEQAVIDANLHSLQTALVHLGTEIYCWHPSSDIPHKASPTDMGAAMYAEILRTQLVKVG